MEVNEDKNYKKKAKQCMYCSRNSNSAYGNAGRCFLCGYNVMKRKVAITNLQRKNLDFINRRTFSWKKTIKNYTVVDRRRIGYDNIMMTESLPTSVIIKVFTENE